LMENSLFKYLLSALPMGSIMSGLCFAYDIARHD
jgi:hypothetical protein